MRSAAGSTCKTASYCPKRMIDNYNNALYAIQALMNGFKIEFNNGDVSVGMDVTVIRINGEWKIDFVIPMMQVLLDMMQGFTDGLDIN